MAIRKGLKRSGIVAIVSLGITYTAFELGEIGREKANAVRQEFLAVDQAVTLDSKLNRLEKHGKTDSQEYQVVQTERDELLSDNATQSAYTTWSRYNESARLSHAVGIIASIWALVSLTMAGVYGAELNFYKPETKKG
jgi:hypothetical protein